MKFKAEINVMPHKELLDPQGKTVARNMDHVGITGVEDVRIGKRIEIALEAPDAEAARQVVDQACKNSWPISSWRPILLRSSLLNLCCISSPLPSVTWATSRIAR